MYNNNTLLDRRAAFSSGDLETSSAAQVLVRCFDRLDADLDRAVASISDGNHEVTNRELGHAQDLLGEVAAMVDPTVWEHADSLLAVYDYVLRLLAVGNIEKHDAPVLEARRLLAEIGTGFRSAAEQVERRPVAQPPAAPSAVAPPATGSVPPDTRPGFSVLA